ncbi:MAG: hypothetical protein H0X24_20410 [Ktedonobacterales bacterium]|nr:hypothetical protein [Ktedonobacterales bacterium]
MPRNDLLRASGRCGPNARIADMGVKFGLFVPADQVEYDGHNGNALVDLNILLSGRECASQEAARLMGSKIGCFTYYLAKVIGEEEFGGEQFVESGDITVQHGETETLLVFQRLRLKRWIHGASLTCASQYIAASMLSNTLQVHQANVGEGTYGHVGYPHSRVELLADRHLAKTVWMKRAT